MYCLTCKERKSCKEICEELKKYLESQGIHSPDYIRPKVPKSLRDWEKKHLHKVGSKWREIPFSTLSDKPIDKNPMLN